MKVQIVYLSSADDIDSTRDMLGWIQAPRVLLVWPDRGRVLSQPFELVRILRYAQSRNIQIGLLTFDREVRQNASELGLPIFDSLDDLPESRWNVDHPHHEWSTEEALARHIADSPLPSKRGVPEWAEELGKRRARKSGVLIVGITLLLVLFILPSAEIILTPERQTNQESFFITLEADQRGLVGDLHLPVEIVESEIEGSAVHPTSGWINIPTEHATGIVRFTNHTQDSVNIPSNTILRTSEIGAISFRTLKTVTLPGGIGASIEALVESTTPGAEGNVAPRAISSIEGPIGLVVSVSNPRSITGGADDTLPMVTEGDLECLESWLSAELIEQAWLSVNSQIGEYQAILESGVWITDIIERDFNHDKGQVGEVLELKMRVNTAALTYHQQALEELIIDHILSTVPEGKEMVTNSLEYNIQVVGPSLDDEKWELGIRADYQVHDSIEEREIRGMILGKATESIDPILRDAIPSLEKSDIRLSPRWLPVIPLWSERVMFRLGWE